MKVSFILYLNYHIFRPYFHYYLISVQNCRKSMTNYWHNQSDVILFFSFIVRRTNVKLKLHCLTCSWKIHQQMKDDCRRENEERYWLLSQEYHLKQWKSLLDFELDGADAFYLLHALWHLPVNCVTSLLFYLILEELVSKVLWGYFLIPDCY